MKISYLLVSLRCISALARPIYPTETTSRVELATPRRHAGLLRRSDILGENYNQWYQSLSERRRKLSKASQQIQAKQHKDSSNRIKHSTSQNFDLEYEPDWLDGLVIQTKGLTVGSNSYKVPHNRGIDARRGVPNRMVHDVEDEEEDPANHFWDPNCPRYNQSAQDKIPNFPRPDRVDPPTRSPARGDIEAGTENRKGEEVRLPPQTSFSSIASHSGRLGGLGFEPSSTSLFIAVAYLICLL